jgi:hypothetical protein
VLRQSRLHQHALPFNVIVLAFHARYTILAGVSACCTTPNAGPRRCLRIQDAADRTCEPMRSAAPRAQCQPSIRGIFRSIDTGSRTSTTERCLSHKMTSPLKFINAHLIKPMAPPVLDILSKLKEEKPSWWNLLCSALHDPHPMIFSVLPCLRSGVGHSSDHLR